MFLHYQSGASVNNNGGSLMTYPISASLLSDIAPNAGSDLAYSSGPVDNDNTDKAVSANTFAKNTDSLLSMRSDVTGLLNASIYPEYTLSLIHI